MIQLHESIEIGMYGHGQQLVPSVEAIFENIFIFILFEYVLRIFRWKSAW